MPPESSTRYRPNLDYDPEARRQESLREFAAQNGERRQIQIQIQIQNQNQNQNQSQNQQKQRNHRLSRAASAPPSVVATPARDQQINGTASATRATSKSRRGRKSSSAAVALDPIAEASGTNGSARAASPKNIVPVDTPLSPRAAPSYVSGNSPLLPRPELPISVIHETTLLHRGPGQEEVVHSPNGTRYIFPPEPPMNAEAGPSHRPVQGYLSPRPSVASSSATYRSAVGNPPVTTVAAAVSALAGMPVNDNANGSARPPKHTTQDTLGLTHRSPPTSPRSKRPDASMDRDRPAAPPRPPSISSIRTEDPPEGPEPTPPKEKPCPYVEKFRGVLKKKNLGFEALTADNQDDIRRRIYTEAMNVDNRIAIDTFVPHAVGRRDVDIATFTRKAEEALTRIWNEDQDRKEREKDMDRRRKLWSKYYARQEKRQAKRAKRRAEKAEKRRRAEEEKEEKERKDAERMAAIADGRAVNENKFWCCAFTLRC